MTLLPVSTDAINVAWRSTGSELRRLRRFTETIGWD